MKLHKGETDSKLLGLSHQESQILALAALGLTDKEIAHARGVGIATVRTYWVRLKRKLNAKNKAHAIAVAKPEMERQRAANEVSGYLLRQVDDEVMVMCDVDRRFITWNKGVLTVLGYDEGEWIGQRSTMIFPPGETSDPQPGADPSSDDERKAGGSWHVRKDGSLIWGTNIVIPFESIHAPAAYAMIVRPKPPPDSKQQ